MAEVQKKVETRGRPRLSEDTRLTGKQLKFVELVATREGTGHATKSGRRSGIQYQRRAYTGLRDAQP